MAKIKSPLEIYPYLPKNIDVFQRSKMAVAAQLAGRQIKAKEIKNAYHADEIQNYNKLEELLKPTIAEIEIGVGDKMVTIGGDDVIFRHALSFYNKTPIAVDVWDTMDEKELSERLLTIHSFQKFYVGAFLHLDMIAIRSVSGDPKTFKKCVQTVVKNTDLPIVLCTKNPVLMREGLKASAGKNPLMYACDFSNCDEMTKLALEFDVPMVVSCPNDLEMLKILCVAVQKAGLTKLVLDPGTGVWGTSLRQTFQNFIKLRKAGIDGDKDLAFPIIALPIASHGAVSENEDENKNEKGLPPEVAAGYKETIIAAALTIRYADMMIIHGTDAYELLPLVHVTDMIYTDPRTPSSVEPKMYEIGTPDKTSPVLFTTNFALTYYTVESDLLSAGFNGYLLAVNTGGLGVEAAVAGGQLTADVISKDFEKAGFDIKEKTSHHTLILPGLAARLQNDIEKLMGVSTLIGPMDSGRLAKWLEDNKLK
jgi:acetyl-CoA decarbonylase/synthase complex subunit gamma